jgi:DNA ligase-associated metallophosphoesterase
MHVTIAGEHITLLPDKAAYWPARHTLLVADPHFGKAATFRLSGLFVPRGTTALALERLDALVTVTGTTRLIFLGDFLHARRGRSGAVLDALAAWHQRHPALEKILVRGNHDRQAGDPPPETGIRAVDAPFLDGPFALVHHPVVVPSAYALAGHLHPCATLRGGGRQRMRLPCFWFGRETGVLPAFGEFTGCAEIEAVEGDQVCVVADGSVVEVSRPSRVT